MLQFPEVLWVVSFSHLRTRFWVGDSVRDNVPLAVSRDSWAVVQSSLFGYHHEPSYVLPCHFCVIRRRSNMSKRIHSTQEDDRRTCGSKAEVSVFDFNKLERKTILVLWSRCFQCPRESPAGFGDCQRSFGKLQSRHSSCVKLILVNKSAS